MSNSMHDVVADALATIKAPKWAVTVGDWEFDCDGSAVREVNGVVRSAAPCGICASEPIGEGDVRVYLSQMQRSDGPGSGECVELSMPHSWAELSSESARSLAQALIEAADELDAAKAAE